MKNIKKRIGVKRPYRISEHIFPMFFFIRNHSARITMRSSSLMPYRNDATYICIYSTKLGSNRELYGPETETAETQKPILPGMSTSPTVLPNADHFLNFKVDRWQGPFKVYSARLYVVLIHSENTLIDNILPGFQHLPTLFPHKFRFGLLFATINQTLGEKKLNAKVLPKILKYYRTPPCEIKKLHPTRRQDSGD